MEEEEEEKMEEEVEDKMEEEVEEEETPSAETHIKVKNSCSVCTFGAFDFCPDCVVMVLVGGGVRHSCTAFKFKCINNNQPHCF